MTDPKLGLAVIGTGMAATPHARALRDLADRIDVRGVYSRTKEKREAFAAEYGFPAAGSIDALADNPTVDAVLLITPPNQRIELVRRFAEAGKHILMEKPVERTTGAAEEAVRICEANGVRLGIVLQHRYREASQKLKSLIDVGALGPIGLARADVPWWREQSYYDEPGRGTYERDGGGVLISQAIHQIDVVRRLAGGLATRVTAMTGAWDPARPTEGAFSALIAFANGSFASLTYSGYAHFDSDEWMGWTGELGNEKDPKAYGDARRKLKSVSSEDEIKLKSARTYGSGDMPKPASRYEHFGPIIVSCDRADLRLTPEGVHVYGDTEREFRAAPDLLYPRKEVIDAVVATVRGEKPPAQTGAWGLASLEVCRAILSAAESGMPVTLEHQTGLETTTS